MDSKTKINRDQETHYINVCTKFEHFFFSIHQAMNAEHDNSYNVTLGYLTLGYLGQISPGH